MIDTQRLGALLRTLIRVDAEDARLRTPTVAAVRPAARIGPELDASDPRIARMPAQEAEAAAHVTLTSSADEPLTSRDAAQPSDRAATRAAPSAGSASGPGRTPPSAALELSDTGRLLLSALRAQGAPLDGVTVPRGAMQPVLHARDEAPDAPAAATRARPLVAVPPHSEYATDRLALQLKDAVEFSGVFYESHLAQWADDLRPRALLAHEPQARWPVAADIAQAPATPNGTQADHATPVLRQQLEVLDTGRFLWRGELWPGQSGSLVIEEDPQPPSRHAGEPPRAPRWRVRLALEFRELGTIEAGLTLTGDALDVGLRCEAPGMAERLRAATPTLRSAIAERALDLTHVTIDDDRA
jgi:hypothetical protein